MTCGRAALPDDAQAQLLRVQSRSRRKHKRSRECEPHGEADPSRQSTAEEAAAARPVKPTAMHRPDRTRAGAPGHTPH